MRGGVVQLREGFMAGSVVQLRDGFMAGSVVQLREGFMAGSLVQSGCVGQCPSSTGCQCPSVAVVV